MKYEREYMGMKIFSEFVDSSELTNEEKELPVTQMSCICFDNQGKVLIVSDRPDRWIIPGGKPEEGETMEESVRREELEEACVELGEVKFVGMMKVHFQDNPNKDEGDNFLQARFVGNISNILESKEDPATGRIFERKFVSSEEFSSYIKWPESEELISKAKESILGLNEVA